MGRRHRHCFREDIVGGLMQAVNSGWPCLLVPAQQGAGRLGATFTVSSQCPPSPLCEPFPVTTLLAQPQSSPESPKVLSCFWNTPQGIQDNLGARADSAAALGVGLAMHRGWLHLSVFLYSFACDQTVLTKHILLGGLRWYKACQIYAKPWIAS